MKGCFFKTVNNRKSMPGGSNTGFTVIELLVATVILMLLSVVLASIFNHATSIWSRSESRLELREAARAILNLMRNDLVQAASPVFAGGTNALRLVVNPAGIPGDLLNRDAIFWSAPVASDQGSGDLAVVGYFVRETSRGGRLCRLLINPNESGYPENSSMEDMVAGSVLDTKAPGDEANDYRGLFLENVLGMWVDAYDAAGNKYTNYDFLDAGIMPASMRISLVLLDKTGARRAEGIAGALPAAGAYSSATDYINNVNENMRAHVENVSINVSFSL